MTQPLALVIYERLLPGSQLVNRLQDLHYRVQTLTSASRLVESAEQLKPMLVLVDLEAREICAAVSRLKKNGQTQHLPVVAFGGEATDELQAAAREAGVTLSVSDGAILDHLPECLEQALRLE